MAEEQALDRVHRIGQTQPVIATRYIVSGSVEEVGISHVVSKFLTSLIVCSNSTLSLCRERKWT